MSVYMWGCIQTVNIKGVIHLFITVSFWTYHRGECSAQRLKEQTKTD